MGNLSLTSMNRIITVSIFALLLTLSFSSCKEIGPNIDLGGPGRDATLADTTYVAAAVETPQTKKVLLEDFTGVRCKNCPLGAAQASSLLALYPDRLVVMAQHSQFLNQPYDGEPDLRIDEAQDLETMLAPVLGKPSGAIDRRIFPGETVILQASVNKWANLTTQALTETTPVNLYIEKDWNSTTRNLTVTVTVHYTGTETGENRLSVFLLEDNIVAAQLQPNDEVDSNYVQRHVMRQMFTRFNGELLIGDKTPGTVFEKGFIIEGVDAEFNADELEIVAIVSRSAGSFQVLQVADVKVVQ
jgi:hypothetical protein